MSDFRMLLGSARAAVHVSRASGHGAPRAVARAFAGELLGADATMRRRAIQLVASLQGRGALRIDLDAVHRVWRDVEEMRAPSPPPRRVQAPAYGRAAAPVLVRPPLPVDQARAVPIARVLSHLRVRAWPSGRTLACRCPFPDHNDSSPSFSVDPKRGLWYCHGCGRGGDSIRLIELLRGAEFSAAVMEVASC